MAPMLDTLRREAEALSQGRHEIGVEDSARRRPVRLATRNCTARSPTWSATRCATRRPAARIDIRFARDADGGAALSVQRHRLRHPAAAPAAHHRALLPRLDQPLARKRRHRPGPVDRQARAEPAPGAAGDRQRSRPRQHASPAISAPSACARASPHRTSPCHEAASP